MNRLTDQQLKEHYKTLPKEITDVIYGADIDLQLYNIGMDAGLAEDDAIIFVGIGNLILVKLVSESESANFISTALAIELPQADKIAKQIFADIVSTYRPAYDGLKVTQASSEVGPSTMSEANVVGEATSLPHAPVVNPVSPESKPVSWREFVVKQG